MLPVPSQSPSTLPLLLRPCCCITNGLATRRTDVEDDCKPYRSELFAALCFHQHQIVNGTNWWLGTLFLKAPFCHQSMLARTTSVLREHLASGCAFILRMGYCCYATGERTPSPWKRGNNSSHSKWRGACGSAPLRLKNRRGNRTRKSRANLGLGRRGFCPDPRSRWRRR